MKAQSAMKFEGQLLAGRWRLGPRLGHGAQADTYLARDEKAPVPGRGKGKAGKDRPEDAADPVVVVKQLHLARREGWKAFDLFEREARVLKALDHPGIPRFLDSFEEGPGVFNLVMERAPGATLWAYGQRVRFGDAELRDILVKTLEILAYLHKLNPPVIHRDIKPQNLVRAADGHVSLVDFGGVREVLRIDGGSTVIGTFGYMAPEQLHGEATPATDLYGLGATIVALAGGVEPEKVPRKGLRMDLVRHLPDMEPRLRAALIAMTEPDPADRPATATEVLKLLGRASRKARAAVATARSASSARAASSARNLPAPRAPGPPGANAHIHEAIARVVDEVAEFTSELPGPLQVLVRLTVIMVGVTGYLGATILRLALLPIAFAIAHAAAGPERRERVDDVRRQVEGAADEARAGMRALTLGRRRPQLPP